MASGPDPQVLRERAGWPWSRRCGSGDFRGTCPGAADPLDFLRCRDGGCWRVLMELGVAVSDGGEGLVGVVFVSD